MADGQDASLYLKQWENQKTLHGVKHGGTADLVDLLGPLALLRSRLHHDAMVGPHVALYPDMLPVVYPS